MTKTKASLLGFEASGTIADAITFQKRKGTKFARQKPIPTDPKSLAQMSWRHMYQKAVALWHALSKTEKQEWESLARSRHMTGFAWFMSQCLKPNPGIYLPLQGGTMQGDIHMDSHLIDGLPSPTTNTEAARKKYIDDAIAAHIAVLDAHTRNLMGVMRTGEYISGLPNRAPGFPKAIVANRLYEYLLLISRNLTIDRIATWVTSQAIKGDRKPQEQHPTKHHQRGMS